MVTKSDKFQNVHATNLEEALRGTLLNFPRQGFSFTELWEHLSQSDSKEIFFNRYFGRVGAVWISERGTDFSQWNLPTVVPNGDLEAGGAYNSINMVNSKDGVTVDELYMSPKDMAFRRAKLIFDAFLPDPANLPAGAVIVIGFETARQGGYSIADLFMTRNITRLTIHGIGEQGLVGESLDIVLTHTGEWSGYILDYDPPYLRLFEEPPGGGLINTLVGEVMLETPSLDYLRPFFANESSVIVGDDVAERFELGVWAVWAHHRSRDTIEIPLWEAEVVPDTGTNSGVIETLGVDKKCFYLLSDQAATVGTLTEGMHIQVWDPVNAVYRTIDSVSVAANVLTSYETRRASRRMIVNFIPAVEANVDLWAVIE